MRLWKAMLENLIGDLILSVAGGCAAIGFILLGSQILMDLTGGK